jgi:hypothetical protein
VCLGTTRRGGEPPLCVFALVLLVRPYTYLEDLVHEVRLLGEPELDVARLDPVAGLAAPLRRRAPSAWGTQRSDGGVVPWQWWREHCMGGWQRQRADAGSTQSDAGCGGMASCARGSGP